MDVTTVGVDGVAGDPPGLLKNGEAEEVMAPDATALPAIRPCAWKCDQLCHPDGITAPRKSGCLQETERASKPAG